VINLKCNQYSKNCLDYIYFGKKNKVERICIIGKCKPNCKKKVSKYGGISSDSNTM